MSKNECILNLQVEVPISVFIVRVLRKYVEGLHGNGVSARAMKLIERFIYILIEHSI